MCGTECAEESNQVMVSNYPANRWALFITIDYEHSPAQAWAYLSTLDNIQACCLYTTTRYTPMALTRKPGFQGIDTHC
jgi:hypothetical protein